jgi:hypothetical protein
MNVYGTRLALLPRGGTGDGPPALPRTICLLGSERGGRTRCRCARAACRLRLHGSTALSRAGRSRRGVPQRAEGHPLERRAIGRSASGPSRGTCRPGRQLSAGGCSDGHAPRSGHRPRRTAACRCRYERNDQPPPRKWLPAGNTEHPATRWPDVRRCRDTTPIRAGTQLRRRPGSVQAGGAGRPGGACRRNYGRPRRDLQAGPVLVDIRIAIRARQSGGEPRATGRGRSAFSGTTPCGRRESAAVYGSARLLSAATAPRRITKRHFQIAYNTG